MNVELKFVAEGRCRLCERSSSVRRLTRHRIVPGSAGGIYAHTNVVPLCRPCHDLIDNRDWSTKRRARQMLRALLWPVEIAAAKRAAGWIGWSFDHEYPKPIRELVLERRLELLAELASG